MDGQRKRQIEVFSAGCAVCNGAVELVQKLAGEFDEVKVHDTQNREVIQLVQDWDVRSVPAVVITASKLAPCCAAGRGPDEGVLRQAGIGQPLKGAQKRLVEVFSAGCSVCQEAVKLVQQLACKSCEVKIYNMKDENVIHLAKSLDIRSVPAVVITAGELAPCCSGRGPDEEVLRQAGVGQQVK